MRHIIFLIASVISFTTYSQETEHKFRVGLNGTGYMNLDKINKSNSQYVEFSFDYLVTNRVRLGIGVDYNITNKKRQGVSSGIDSTYNKTVTRSGLGAQVYLDYIFLKKTNFDMYARVGIGANFPLNEYNEIDNFVGGHKVSETDFNTPKTNVPVQIRYTLGVGGEYKIKDFLAIGLELNYRYLGLGYDQTYGLGLKLGVNYRF